MPAASERSLQRVWPAALLVLASVLPYLGTLNYPLIFDDYTAVIENPRIRTLWPVTEPLTVDADTPLSSRPVAQLSLAVNYAISGLSPWSYRVGNIALHAACALLVWGLLARVLPRPRDAAGERTDPAMLPLAIALLWAVHPLNTETVVYVTQRTELLVSFLLLVTLAAAFRGFDAEAAGDARRRRLWFVVAIVACWLGMATKEVMVGAPLFVLLIDRGVVSGTFAAALRRHWPLYAALFASWALLAAVVVLSPRSQSAGFDLGVSPLEYLYTQAGVLLTYLKLSFWPQPLSVVYHVDIVESLGGALPEGLVIAALLVASAVALWRNHPAGLAGACFFVILAPSSSIVPIVSEVAAERRMYLPLVAVLAVAIVALDRILRAAVPVLRPRIAGGLLIVAAAALTLVSVVRLQAYATETRIWKDALEKHPRSYLAHQGYGNMLLREGETERGFEHRLRAVQLNPFFPERTLEVASLLVDRGRFEEALHWLTHLKEHAKPHAVVLLNRGGILAHLGREAEAEVDLREAMAVDPTLPEPWLNMGVMRARQGRLEEARRFVLEALERAPDSAQARAVLAQIDRDLAARGANESGGP